MTSFFSTFSFLAKYAILFPAIIIVWTLLIGGTVQEAPFGLDTVLTIVANGIATIRDIFPFMEPVINVFFWGVQIKIALLIIKGIMWIVSIYASK